MLPASAVGEIYWWQYCFDNTFSLENNEEGWGFLFLFGYYMFFIEWWSGHSMPPQRTAWRLDVDFPDQHYSFIQKEMLYCMLVVWCDSNNQFNLDHRGWNYIYFVTWVRPDCFAYTCICTIELHWASFV